MHYTKQITAPYMYATLPNISTVGKMYFRTQIHYTMQCRFTTK